MAEVNTILQLVAKIRRIRSFLRLRPFDVSTPQGRADERHRRIVLSAFASATAKGVSALTGFISLPLTWHYLDDERQGIWMTLSSIIILLGFTDLGIGSGLLNRISEAHAKNDRDEARRAVSSAFFMLLGIGSWLFLIFLCFNSSLDWAHFLKLKSVQAAMEAKPAAAICAACFALSLPLGVVNRIQLGHQEGFVNSLWSMAGNVLGLMAVLTAIHFHAGLPWLVLGLAGGPVAASLLNGTVLFIYQRPWLRPCLSQADAASAGSLMRLGSVFFVIQLASSLAYTTDYLIIGKILDQKTVAGYSAIAKMFSLAPMIMEMFLSPLWPAYNEATARGDFAWIKKTLIRSLKMGLLLSVFLAAALVSCGGFILRIWTGKPISPPFLLLLGFGLWSIFAITGSAVAMFLNGSGAIRFQAGCAIAMGFVALIAKIFLCQRFGLTGVIWATALSYLVCIALPMALFVPKFLSRLRKISPTPHPSLP